MVVETVNKERQFLENLDALVAESNLDWLGIKAVLGAYVQNVEAQRAQAVMNALTKKSPEQAITLAVHKQVLDEEAREIEQEADEERVNEAALEEEIEQAPVPVKPKSFKERMVELKKRNAARGA